MSKDFHCHMCDQIFPGAPVMRVSLIGFNWQPNLHENPGQLLDLCEACQHAVLKAYAKAKNERLEEIYQKQSTIWIKEKMEELEKARRQPVNRQRYAVRNTRVNEVFTSPSLNYRKEEKQHTWRF